jgi:hypothetical protein
VRVESSNGDAGQWQAAERTELNPLWLKILRVSNVSVMMNPGSNLDVYRATAYQMYKSFRNAIDDMLSGWARI